MPVDLESRIVAIIETVSKQPVKVGPDESLFDSGLLDSFALPDMVTALEKESHEPVQTQEVATQR